LKSSDEDSGCDELENVFWTEFVNENSKNMKKPHFAVSVGSKKCYESKG
jgi:hypothetical protein